MNYYYKLSLTFLCCSLAIDTGARQRIPSLNGYNPGPCNSTNHGKEVLTKDRHDEEIILICVKDKNGFKWKSTDGTKNTVGEFFNPGYDCADILNKQQNSADGFYWITLNGPKIYKVWCDMTTDSGGFMLVGKKKGPKTWSVPSTSIPLQPFGDAHWLSSLGDAPIMDFRIQIATTDDFKNTKAHWFFRLQSKRPLKNLMIATDGCDQRSAGIGNIAYVKDLMTEKIVTTNLRCSKFGFAHNASLGFGWAMMNSCLRKPCPYGFAFFPLVKGFQTDTYGAFSFSTTETMSGMEYNSTAFVGCDNGQCCACYGPVGGTKNYCVENCKTINGGTITKNVYTWFWVRSSLPKRLWKKCMDYQVKRHDGKLISYKLVGHNTVPVEGNCNKASPLLHDGIVVVPDSSTAQKVPPIEGLLEYRKDNQELYVRSNKAWNMVAQEEKVQQEIDQLNRSIRKINASLFMIFNLLNHKECRQYTWILESYRNAAHATTTYLCDNGLTTGWYRFGGGAGTRMPTSCIPEHRCQTDYTGWMNGAHPTIADGKVKRTVCYGHPPNLGCCRYSTSIEVINCGLYYVYKLGPTPACNLGYCGTNN